MMKKRNLFLLLLLFIGNLLIFSQSCTINAGANKPICGTSTTLQATSGGTVSSSPPTWSILSKPAGATDPVFSNPNVLNPTVTEINSPGNYVFRITQPCTTGAPAVSDVTITAPGSIAGFTAGPDITGISALIGEATLNATIPDGYTASWTYYNLYSFEFNTAILTDNATMSNTTTATPTLTLGSKANHTIDPAYRAVLRIISTNNPNCWYEDNAIVRFTPNPNMLFPGTYSQCLSPGTTGANFYYDPSTNSPRFSTTTTNSSGNSAYGTVVTMTPVTQPVGGDIQYSRMVNGRLYFSGITAIGAYVFDLTIQNSLGSYTQRLTYNFNGFQPNAMTFVDSAYPNQTELYSSGSSGGAVFCNMAGSTNDITFYYKLNSADPPTLTSSVALSGPDNPSGGAPSIVQNGAGTATRSATLTPPAGGWRVGTYRFAVTLTAAGGCSRQSLFYVHISDNARPAVNVNNITVCYSGSGVVSATVPLPASYIAPASNPSYLQGSGGRYDFTVVTRPAGAAIPSFEAQSFRTLTSASTVISNLDRAGEYVFRIKAVGNGSGKILTDEYACSGTSLEDTFSIFVTPQVNSNAGSDQNIITAITTTATLNGNNAGTSTGTWSLVSKPASAPDPVIVSPSVPNTNVSGLNTVGAYTFRWTIATGSCTSFDDVIVNVNAASPAGVSNGLTYWYRADVNAANTGAGTDVTGWTDMWNGTTVAQLGTNALPKYAVGTSSYFNFNPGINFTAITQTIGNNSVQTIFNANNDLFMVTKEGMTAPGSPNPHFFSIGMDNTTATINNWDYLGLWPTGLVERRVYNGGTNFPTVSPGHSPSIPSIMYYNFLNQPYSRGLNGAANGATYNSTGAMGIPLGGHIFGDSRFSSNNSDNGGFIGNIGETIIYGNGNLTATERRRVDSYLAIKYGITLGQVATDHYLDADAAIVWNGATNTTYNNNIFGVAREDIGLFEQKVSKSVNTGTILTVATTNDFVNPNQDAARTGFAQDKTYLLLGDNNNTNLALNSITVNGFTGGSRIQRQWLAQPTNDVGTVNFGVDLASYGAGFESGAAVKMLVADDAAFTTNVEYVNGTYNTTSGQLAHPYTFVTGQNKYITYVTVDETSCITGCNDNTYLNAVDPNTIEYDNIIADETTTIVKQKDGSYYVWGPNTSPNVSSTNANVVLNLLTPTKIDPSTTLPTAGSSGAGFNYTGTPLKAAIANVMHLLTTDGLYVWGNGNMYTLNIIGNTAITYRTPSGFRFGKLTVNNKADGLPPGVSPTNVKMMSGNQETITIVTCSGAAWVLSQSSVGSVYGDNMTGSVANNSIWHRVMTSATQTLDNVVAVRGIRSTKFALTSDGKLYTWGLNTFHNDNTAGATSNYATEISVPAGVTPKMIGMTEGNTEGQGSYYLLATNGKLYAMGYNTQRQLGLGDTIIRLNWTEVTATSGSNTLGSNIAWISPAENVNNLPSINVLTTAGKQWGWGRSSQGHLGVVDNLGINPTYMPGNGTGTNELNLSDKVIAVKDGGQHAINFKESSTRYGFIGFNTFGSKGDGTSVTGTQDLKYTYISNLDICAITGSAFCYKPGITVGTALDTKVGITALNRAGATDSDNWPMTRKGGWLALEAKTKGFVPNRVAFDASGNPIGISAANFVEGMMVYDTTNKCMKMYTLKDGDTSMAWHCVTTQTCPD